MPLLVLASIWWATVLVWLLEQVELIRNSRPVAAQDIWGLAVAAFVALSATLILAMSLFRRRIWATKLAMALLSVTTFLVLLIGLVISIKTLFSPERPAVAAVILAETLAVAVISALSAWLFRCWLRDIEAYEAEK